MPSSPPPSPSGRFGAERRKHATRQFETRQFIGTRRRGLVPGVILAAMGVLLAGCTTVAITTPPGTREAELALTSPLRAEARRLIAEYQARKWVPAPGNPLGAIANVLLGGGGEATTPEALRRDTLDKYLAGKQTDAPDVTAVRAAVEEDLRLALRAARALNRAAENALKARELSPLWREELTDLERASFSLDRGNQLFADVREWLSLPPVAPDANGAEVTGEAPAAIPAPATELVRIDIDRAHLRAEHDRSVALSEALALRGAQTEERRGAQTEERRGAQTEERRGAQTEERRGAQTEERRGAQTEEGRRNSLRTNSVPPRTPSTGT